jgi:WD40 repeat protein
MADVFISYSQTAPEPTQELAADLTAKRYAVWFDSRLLPGDAFWQVIEDKIRAAKAVIVIWTKAALTSRGVRAEAQLAYDLNRLICLRVPEVVASEVRLPFNALEQTLISDRAKIYAKLAELNVRPEGGAAPLLPKGERDAGEAAMAWDHIKGMADLDLLEEFLKHYGGGHPFYRKLAERRIADLKPGRMLMPLSSAPAMPEAKDVTLRLDPGMHTATIKRLSLSADGKQLATVSDDKTVRLWELPEGKLLRTFRTAIGPGNDGKMFAVALSPDGRWVAAGGCSSSLDRHFVTIFDAATGAIATRLGPLPNVTNELRATTDGRRLAAGLHGANGIRVWDTTSWQLAFQDADHGGAVYGLAYARDGRLAATSFDGHIRLYDANGRRLAKVKAPGGACPYGIAVSPDGTRLVVGYFDSTRIDVLDAATLQPLLVPDTKGIKIGCFNRVTWLSDGRVAAAGTYWANGCPILAWADCGKGSPETWPGAMGTIMDLAVLPSGGGLVFAAADPAFGLLSADGSRTLFRGPPIADLSAKLGEHFLVSADGRRVRFGLDQCSATPMLLNLSGPTLRSSPTAPTDLRQADTAKLAITDWKDTRAPKLAGTLLQLETYELARSLAVMPDAKSFVVGTEWSLRRFDAAGKSLWVKSVPGVVWGVNLACDGRLLIAAYADGTIRWHRTSDGEELLAFFVHVDREGGTTEAKGWVLWTPAGHYVCSPGAEELIGWHVNRGLDAAADFYPASTFAATFNKPDVVARALDGV